MADYMIGLREQEPFTFKFELIDSFWGIRSMCSISVVSEPILTLLFSAPPPRGIPAVERRKKMHRCALVAKQ